MKDIVIGSNLISQDRPPVVVAELSANHGGRIERALETISAAKKAGAHAIKLQTYSPETMTIDCDLDDFIINEGLWAGYKLYDLYKEAQTPFEWHKQMFEHARNIDITCFSTPFDESAVDLLENLGVPAYKIASFEVTDLPLIKYVASTKKPMILSTGMANYEEIEEMVQTARDGGCADIIVLHCISSYPAPVDQSNLMTIPDLRKKLGVHIGLSDHSLTNTVSVAAIALGAVMVEKHFVVDREEVGPDTPFSIDPKDLQCLVRETKEAFLSLGHAGYDQKPAEKQNIKFRRSLYFVENLPAGAIVTASSIRRIRPGYGAAPKLFDIVIGKKLKKSVLKGTAVDFNLFE